MATPLTDENAAQFLQPVVDDILTQVRGVVDPLRTEVAALKSASAPPQEPQQQQQTPPAENKTGIPEGVDPTDPKSIAAYQAKLEASKVDWNDPAAVAQYHAKLTAGNTPPAEGDGNEQEVPSEKSREIAALKAQLAKLERESNQGGDGTVTAPSIKSAPKINTIEAGHALGDAINTLLSRKKEA